MSKLTIRLPATEKHARLRQLTKHRDISVNKMVEELATISIAEFDAETHFRALPGRGSVKKGFAILDKLDAAHPTSVKPARKHPERGTTAPRSSIPMEIVFDRGAFGAEEAGAQNHALGPISSVFQPWRLHVAGLK